MFEYILAGFTGSFFSYYCFYLFGAVTEGISSGTLSETIAKKIEKKINLERIEISLANIQDVLSRHIGR